MALDTLDKIIAGYSGNLNASRRYARVWYATSGVTIPALAHDLSLWRAPSIWQPAIPSTTPATCDRTLLGGFRIVPPSAGGDLYVARLSYTGSFGGILRMYDRLAHVGGLSGSATTLQTFAGGASLTLPARASGLTDVQMYLEGYAATGSTASTLTITYTNQSGTSGRQAVVVWPNYSAWQPGTWGLVTLAGGDTGVQSVQSVQWSASTGGAGNWGITLARPIEPVVAVGGAGTDMTNYQIDAFRTGLPTVHPDSCIMFSMQPNGTGQITRPSVVFNLIEA